MGTEADNACWRIISDEYLLSHRAIGYVQPVSG